MGSVPIKNLYIRKAHHAGSWYSDDRDRLSHELEGFLRSAESPQVKKLRAVIVPHAGYSYSGPTAAYAYKAVTQELEQPESPISQILVLHPSHHLYLSGQCAVSNAKTLDTPIARLHVDDELRSEILGLSKRFTLMSKNDDEAEHSGEMQYPYLALCLQKTNKLDSVTVTPVMCGSLNIEDEATFGSLLGDIMSRPNVLVVVSTDFCHWGQRFSYQPTDEKVPVHKFIEAMDRRGMDLIASQKPGAFADYLKDTRNTICGRHAVAVWLQGSEKSSVEFVRYAQSSPALTKDDSSVSYAAAVATSS